MFDLLTLPCCKLNCKAKESIQVCNVFVQRISCDWTEGIVECLHHLYVDSGFFLLLPCPSHRFVVKILKLLAGLRRTSTHRQLCIYWEARNNTPYLSFFGTCSADIIWYIMMWCHFTKSEAILYCNTTYYVMYYYAISYHVTNEHWISR
jgi:hypothetical protein